MPRNASQIKTALYEQLARIGKSLATGPRLEILDLLCQAARTVESLARQVGQSVANTPHHLQILRRARLVEADRKGVFVTYRLADGEVCSFICTLRRLAESRLLEIEHVARQFFREPGTMEPVDREALIGRVRRGDVTVLDVRPVEEYRVGHIPGAISVPLAELKRRLAELPRHREVVAYCRGRYCVMAHEAVALLRENGFKALRMRDGIPDWQAQGLPVEATPVGAEPAIFGQPTPGDVVMERAAGSGLPLAMPSDRYVEPAV